MAKSQWWGTRSPEMQEYHDHEWGFPQHDDNRLFEHLALETLQIGLNWEMILKKRAAFRAAFFNFDIDRVAAMTPEEIEGLLTRPDLIRNARKLNAIVNNARVAQELRRQWGSFDAFVWHFTDGKAIVNQPKTPEDIPTQTPLSEEFARTLKDAGMTMVGPVTMYAFLQAVGVIDDHLIDFKRSEM